MLTNDPGQLYLGDCLTVLPRIAGMGTKVDAVIADIPYGTTACKWDSVIPLAAMWAALRLITKPNTPILLFGRQPFTSALVMSNPQQYRHKWVWNKKQSGSFHTAKYMPLQIEEDIVCFSRETANYYPIMRKGAMRKRGGARETNATMHRTFVVGYENYSDLYYPVNVIEMANPRIGRRHPTQKPLDLIKYLTSTYTKPGDLVLDFAAGSGTTAIACMELGRRFILIEKDSGIKQIAADRLRRRWNALCEEKHDG